MNKLIAGKLSTVAAIATLSMVAYGQKESVVSKSQIASSRNQTIARLQQNLVDLTAGDSPVFPANTVTNKLYSVFSDCLELGLSMDRTFKLTTGAGAMYRIDHPKAPISREMKDFLDNFVTNAAIADASKLKDFIKPGKIISTANSMLSDLQHIIHAP